MTNAEKKSLAEWFFGLKRKLVKAVDTVIDKTAHISPPEPAPALSPFADSKHHDRVLRSNVCDGVKSTGCGEPKTVGSYFCDACKKTLSVKR